MGVLARKSRLLGEYKGRKKRGLESEKKEQKNRPQSKEKCRGTKIRECSAFKARRMLGTPIRGEEVLRKL